jgi:hypothetical protein
MLSKPSRDANYVQYLGWYVCYSRAGLEVMARCVGVELDPPRLPEAAPSRRGIAHDHLVELLDPDRIIGDDPAARERAYDFDRMQRLAVYLERSDRHGPALDADDLDDVEKLLGSRPATWEEGDARLEKLVLEAGPERDADFIRYFHRRLCREESLLEPVLREQRNRTFPPLEDDGRA